MTENLANASTILLFGRVVEDLQIGRRGGSKAPGQSGGKLAAQRAASHTIAEQIAATDSCLARIYAFAYEGNYYDLAGPALFLVRGKGDDIAATVEMTGLPATARKFASDVRVWTCDKSDLSLRLDVQTGMLEQILLESELSGDRLRMSFGGQHARLRTPRGGPSGS